MPRVLTIEDDTVTAQEIAAELSARGIDVELIRDGAGGLDRALGGGFDAITLDRMLPSLDGLALLTRLRQAGVQTPVLMISALSDVDERIRGLRAGGDDYLTKPFAPNEMAARVEVLLRRRQHDRETRLRAADIEIDLVAREVRRGGNLLNLLPTEFKLLEFLVRNAGQVITRAMIFENVWGYSFDPGTNVIDVHMGHLRRKVDPPELPQLIRTVRGQGYVLAVD